MANINFNITQEGIQNNPRLRGTPAFDPSEVQVQMAFNSEQIQAALANLGTTKNTTPLTAGEVKFASGAHTSITSASHGAYGLLGDLVQSALKREAKVRQP